MINYLSIRNFALIENCEINFSEHLNIISGETGSGKSIIIQALAILLGERASLDQIRTGMDEAIISANISINNNKYIYNYLEKLGFPLKMMRFYYEDIFYLMENLVLLLIVLKL